MEEGDSFSTVGTAVAIQIDNSVAVSDGPRNPSLWVWGPIIVGLWLVQIAKSYPALKLLLLLIVSLKSLDSITSPSIASLGISEFKTNPS